MSTVIQNNRVLSDAERKKRKRYLNATLVTCLGIAMLGGAIHVVKLGSNRMKDMKSKASYDLAEMKDHIRAAGEDIHRHREQERNSNYSVSYSVEEVETLLPQHVWHELETMIPIESGIFYMGTNREKSDDYDRPMHERKLESYKIDKYPVTNAQYAQFVAATGYRPPTHWIEGRIPPGLELHPVVMVSWFDASSYAKWAGKRLPSEAEWEKAARGDSKYRWPWGNEMKASNLNTYYSIGSTSEVIRYPAGASVYGVMDMAGNVSEWINDDFRAYEGSPADESVFQGKIGVASTPVDRSMKVADLVVVDGFYKVLRGGSWKSDPFSTTTYHRNFAWPQYASDFFGFRCVSD